MSDNSAERREYIRVGRSLLLAYKVLDTPDGREESVTQDISGGGIKAPFKEKPMVGTLLELEFELLKEKKKLKLKGKIVWVKSYPKDTNYPYEVGIEFIDITSAAQTMLSNYIQYLNRYDLLKGHFR